MTRVLVLNAGSSSLKYQLIEGSKVLAKGLIEEIGSESARLKQDGHEETRPAKDHDDALAWMLETLEFDELRAAGCTRTGAIVAGAEGVAAGTGVPLVPDASSPSAGTADGAGVWEAAGVGDASLSGVQPSAAVSFAASTGLSTASP